MRFFATLGPKSHSVETLKSLFEAGMTGVRLNLSHGNLNEGKPWIDELIEAAKQCGKPYELLVDLNGPEIRIGALEQPLLCNIKDIVTLGEDGIDFPSTAKLLCPCNTPPCKTSNLAWLSLTSKQTKRKRPSSNKTTSPFCKVEKTS